MGLSDLVDNTCYVMSELLYAKIRCQPCTDVTKSGDYALASRQNHTSCHAAGVQGTVHA